MRDNFQIANISFLSFQQAMPYAGFVHLDAEKISVGVGRCLVYQGLAVAEPNLHYGLCCTPEQLVEIE